MRLFNLRLVSGFLKLPDNPTPLPDEKDGPSSGLSRACRVVHLEPDDRERFIYAEFVCRRRVRQVSS
jgi:hypothetical protein